MRLPFGAAGDGGASPPAPAPNRAEAKDACGHGGFGEQEREGPWSDADRQKKQQAGGLDEEPRRQAPGGPLEPREPVHERSADRRAGAEHAEKPEKDAPESLEEAHRVQS